MFQYQFTCVYANSCTLGCCIYYHDDNICSQQWLYHKYSPNHGSQVIILMILFISFINTKFYFPGVSCNMKKKWLLQLWQHLLVAAWLWVPCWVWYLYKCFKAENCYSNTSKTRVPLFLLKTDFKLEMF